MHTRKRHTLLFNKNGNFSLVIKPNAKTLIICVLFVSAFPFPNLALVRQIFLLQEQ